MNQSNMSEQQSEVMSPIQTEAHVQKLTIEQEEEKKLRTKYPNPQKLGGSTFMQKMLHKGNKKYFDSGDYMMAKSKKQTLLNGLNKGAQHPASANVAPSTNNSSTPVSQRLEGMTPNLTKTTDAMSLSELNSPVVNVSSVSESSNLITDNVTNNDSMNSTSSDILKPSTPIQKPSLTFENGNSNFLNTSNNNSTSPLSTSVSSTNLQNNHYSNPMILQTSQSSQSISLLSSSMSTDKLSQIQINQQNPCIAIDSEEIGHCIPTPECLPQSRKHSIVQSKLATPRLSSS